jgi:hypothetical protein
VGGVILMCNYFVWLQKKKLVLATKDASMEFLMQLRSEKESLVDCR